MVYHRGFESLELLGTHLLCVKTDLSFSRLWHFITSISKVEISF